MQLEKMTGVSHSTLQRYICGKTNRIPLDAVKKISVALGVSAGWIMGWDNSDLPYDSPNILPMPSFVKKPRLGTIACGEPILAEQNIEDYDSVPDTIQCDFTLRCKGDSMVDARINDGDIVYIRQQPTVENGEIAAVLIGEDATLKRVYLSPGTVNLVPCNPKYAPMVFTGDKLNEIRILGKAVGFTSVIK